MRIIKAKVSNYKSLKEVEVEFENLTVLIGRNSSGKSNFLEALHLFFVEFDPAPKRDVAEIPEYLWHGKETENPIEFVITMKLTKREWEQIFTESLQTAMGISFKDGRLAVCREVVFKSPNTATWRTSFVALDDTPLVEEGKLVKKLVSLTPKKEDAQARAQAKPPKTPEKVANKKPPTLMNESAVLTEVFKNISQVFKGKFKLILTVRENVSSIPQLSDRSLNIPSDIEKRLLATIDSEKLSDTRTWDKIEKDIGVSPSLRRLSVRGGKLRSREGVLYLPLSYVGGGDQQLVGITLMLRREKSQILAIEEPETHMHPYLSRSLFNILNDVPKNKQLIIATHSPIFIDLVNLNNSWIFGKKDTETKVHRIQSEKDLRLVSYELGIRPSDVFFADKILFVEGSIDKTVYRIWAEKLLIDLKSPTISVISLGGKTKGKRHLQAWIEATRNIPVSVSMILDKDAKNEADKLIKDKLATRTQISVLSKGEIEDYYDRSVLMSVMEERYGEEFTEDDAKLLQSKGLIDFLKRKHGRNWRTFRRAKSEIGEEVATQMTKEQIHDDISRALRRTRDYLELPYTSAS